MLRNILLMLSTGLLLSHLMSFMPAVAEEDLFDTKAASAYLEKGIGHLRSQKYDAAINELEESVAIAPEAEAYYYLGYAYYMKGRSGDSDSRKKSIENFDKAYELNPNFSPNRFKPSEPVPGRFESRGSAQVISAPSQTLSETEQPDTIPSPEATGQQQ
jgi:tetratricopeptide (TPR) repeat protein